MAELAQAMITSLLPDARVGDYVLRQAVSSGSQGEVWLAESVVGTRVALKILRDSSGSSANREIAALRLYAGLAAEHPALVRVLHVGQHGAGVFYVMELADDTDSPGPGPNAAPPGSYVPRSLSNEIAMKGPIQADVAREILDQVLGGVESIHARGLLHRDIKPSNILCVGGRWKLADIGLLTQDRTDVTALGTADFMPPTGAMDKTTDLYACGRVLYCMLTGLPARSFPKLPVAVAEQGRKPLRVLVRAMNRACAPDARNRFKTAAEFRGALAGKVAPFRVPRVRWSSAWPLAALVAFVALAAVGVAKLGVPKVTDGRDWRDLFNGRDLAGWVADASQQGRWRVRDGALVADASSGDTLLTLGESLGPGILRVTLLAGASNAPLTIRYATEQPGGGPSLELKPDGRTVWTRGDDGLFPPNQANNLYELSITRPGNQSASIIEIEWGARRHQIRADGAVVMDLPAWVATGPVVLIAKKGDAVGLRRVQYAAQPLDQVKMSPGSIPAPRPFSSARRENPENGVRSSVGARSTPRTRVDPHGSVAGLPLEIQEEAMMPAFPQFARSVFLSALAFGVQGAQGQTPTFAPPQMIGPGNGSGFGGQSSAAVADFNGDGHADMATVEYSAGRLRVYLGTGNGSMTLLNDQESPGWGPFFVTCADINRDGKQDLIVVQLVGGSVLVYRGNGDGTFQTASGYGVGVYPYAAAIGDLNGDSWPDIAVANSASDSVSVLFNNGGGAFPTSTTVGVGDEPHDLVLVDLNGDGRLDLAVTGDNANGGVTVVLGAPGGTFLAPTFHPTGSGSNGIAAADFNSDGRADIVVSNTYGQSVSVLLGLGTGGLAAPKTIAAVNPWFLSVGDVNGDGRLDVAVTENTGAGGGQTATVLLGDGTGNLVHGISLQTGSVPHDCDMVDLSGDGRMDIVVANWGSNDITILLNTTTPNPGGGCCTEPAFAPPVTSDSGIAYAGGIVSGDFNRDGLADVAVSSYYTNDVSVMFGTGNGTFLQAGRYGVGSHCTDIAAADFNNDGWMDLAVAADIAGIVGILLNNRNGTFAPSQPIPVDARPRGMEVGDFNADGNPDFVVTAQDSNTVNVLLGNGNGSFQPRLAYQVGQRPWSVAMGDLDHDGKPDLAVGNILSATVSLLHNAGDGSFQAWGSIPAPGSHDPLSVTIADFNEDGNNDILVYSWLWPAPAGAGGRFSIHLGNGSGGFTEIWDGQMLGDSAASATVADLNADGHLDVVTTTWNSLVFVRAGRGDGTFGAPVEYTAGSNAIDCAIADYDNDGKPDLAIANNGGSGLVHVFRNTTPPPEPLGVGTTPTSQVLCPNRTASFGVVTSPPASAGLTYRWQIRMGSESAPWQDLPTGLFMYGGREIGFVNGASTPSCAIVNLGIVPSGTLVRCRVTTACETVIGEAVSLQVLPDLYIDGRIDTADLVGLLGRFGSSGQGLREDLNFDGAVNTVDLVQFLAKFGSTCP